MDETSINASEILVQANISRIASQVGVPFFMDKATTAYKKLAFARCFVESSAKKPLPKSLCMEVEGGEKVNIEVEHEWVPPTCKQCPCFGHVESQCPTKETWVPKVTIEDNTQNNVQDLPNDTSNSTARANSQTNTADKRDFSDSVDAQGAQGTKSTHSAQTLQETQETLDQVESSCHADLADSVKVAGSV